MSGQINQPNYVTCPCQHCNGHIEFDVNEFAEENSIVPCPHCSLETKLFIPVSIPAQLPPQLPSPIVSLAVRREGFFYEEPLVQETGTSASVVKIPTPVTAVPSIAQQVQSFVSGENQNQPPIPQKYASGRVHAREMMHLQNFLQEQNEASGFGSKKVTLTEAQCKIPIVQELIGLLVEIEKDGFITDQGARRLNEWMESRLDSEILAFRFLSDKVKRTLSYGKLTTETASGIAVALDLQVGIERVLPKRVREPILEKRRMVEEQLRNNLPASKEVIALIRQHGVKPPLGLSRAEAYDLMDKLRHEPSDKQLSYIRGLGGNPPPHITREEAGEMIGQLLSGVKATESQIQYIRDLGGNPPVGLSQTEASALIQQFLSRQQPTPRQMMILRFWNKPDLMQSSKEEVAAWLEKFYNENPRRKIAWELFKVEIGDDGSQHDPSFVPLGAGEKYLNR